MVKLWVNGETTQVISRVQGMKLRTTFYFSDLFDEEDLWSMHRLVLQLTFCVFLIEDFFRKLLQKSSLILLNAGRCLRGVTFAIEK